MNILEKSDHYSVFRVSRMLSFDQWLQNALNTSDNSSIYNYYAVIIYKVGNSDFLVEGEIGRRNIA